MHIYGRIRVFIMSVRNFSISIRHYILKWPATDYVGNYQTQYSALILFKGNFAFIDHLQTVRGVARRLSL
jgi:hypothetical protein